MSGVALGLIALALALALWAMLAYNRLVRQCNQAHTAWADVDVQLNTYPLRDAPTASIGSSVSSSIA